MKLFFTTCILILSMAIFAPTVFADSASGNTGTSGATGNTAPAPTPAAKIVPSLQNPLKVGDVQSLLGTIVDLAIFIGLIMAVLVFIFIGFKFVMAQGNDSALKDAKQWFLYAVIGTAVLISAKVIVDVVKNTFVSAGVVNESLFKKP